VKPADWIQIGMLIVNASVGGIILWYTRETRRLRQLTNSMVDETRKMRKSQTEPDICVSVVPTRLSRNFLNMEILNFGSAPAHNIRLRAEPDFQHMRSEYISHLGPFKNGINHLPPEGKVVFFFASAIELHKEKRLNSTFTVYADFQNADGENFLRQYDISLSYMEGLSSIGTDPLVSLADSNEGLKKAVEEWKSKSMEYIEYRRWREERYSFVSSVGTFWISPQTGMVGVYLLGIDKLPLGDHRRPWDAAESVHQHRSGYTAWDNNPELSAPEDLRGWHAGIPRYLIP
jgi:hypothetical protein